MKFQEYTDRMNEREVRWRQERDALYARYAAQGKIWGAVPREWIRRLTFERLEPETLRLLRQIADTPSVADILDRIGLRGAIPASELPPVCPGARIVGQAVTQKNLPERRTVTQGALDHVYIGMSTKDAAYLAQPGDVLVVDSCGLRDTSSFGGMAASLYQKLELSGAIVWGAVRDIPAIAEAQFPVWAGAQTCMTGKYRICASEINGPVSISGVLVQPGDVVIADGSGICIVAPEAVDEVVRRLLETKRAEDAMQALISGKGSIDVIRAADRPQYKSHNER